MSFREGSFDSLSFRLGQPAAYRGFVDGLNYPLVVYLHGAGERGIDNKKQIDGLKFLGNGLNPQATTFRRKFHSFVFVPQCPEGSEWVGDTLSVVLKTIIHLASVYPIDSRRLYVIGYSMGGTGAYELAERYHAFTGRYFAGVVRIVGQGYFRMETHAIVSKSAVWLIDTPLRVAKVREAYAALKGLARNSPESVSMFKIKGIKVKTYALVVDGRELYELTEFAGVGHGILELPFVKVDLLEWLFDQVQTEKGLG